MGSLSGITNIGLKSERERFLTRAIGIEIIPKDKNYINASIIQDPGQRQTIAYNLYSRLGLYRQKMNQLLHQYQEEIQKMKV